MFVIVNPSTGAQHMGVFHRLLEAQKEYEASLDTYGVTTDYKIFRLVEFHLRLARGRQKELGNENETT